MHVTERPIEIGTDGDIVHGDLAVPDAPVAVVVFAHGSGSSRFSSRNRHVASRLHDRGLATLLMDLLTASEAEVDHVTGEYRFDIPRLAERLEAAIGRLGHEQSVPDRPVGLFGASTGAAAALVAAARRPDGTGAVVSRGGRPDLAGDALPAVKAPTLLLVGGRDTRVIDMNQRAAARLQVEHRLEVVPGAGHLFEEPGTLEQVSDHAAEWFLHHLDPTTADHQQR